MSERGASTAPRLALGVDEAAAAIGVGQRTFERHVLPHLRVAQVGRRILVPVVELERWLAENAG